MNVAVEVPPQLRDIVAWSHTTLPNTFGALTVNGVVPSVVIVDTGANYVMVGKRLGEQMELKDADLFEGITYNTAEGESHKSRGVTKRKVAIVLRPAKQMRLHSTFMSWSTMQQHTTSCWVRTAFIGSVASSQ